MLRELASYTLEQGSMPLVIGIVLASLLFIGLIQRRHSSHIRDLLETINSRDERLVELEKKLHLFKTSEIQAKLSNLNQLPRRRITAQQKTILVEYARAPEGKQFTIEIIHDMAGSDCRVYANELHNVFQELGGWSISRSAVLRPGWMARCGLGIHVRNREILTRAETMMLNAFAAAGIDYDLVRIPDLDADVGLIVNPAAADRTRLLLSHINRSNAASLQQSHNPDTPFLVSNSRSSEIRPQAKEDATDH